MDEASALAHACSPCKLQRSPMNTTSRFLLAVVASLCLSAAAKDKPNILVIMSDDMGFSDLGCYGSEIATPNLDSLAQGGIRFTPFYNPAPCLPTPPALVPGLYSHQA